MIYAARIDCDTESLRERASAERLMRSERFVHEADRRRCLAVEVLCMMALEEEGVASDAKIRLMHDDKQKPYLCIPGVQESDTPQVSLSHAGEAVAVAIDRFPVGVDLETVRPCKEQIVNRFFTQTEQKYIHRAMDRDLAFTQIWTLKESFVKATGEGLSLGIESFGIEWDKETGLYSYVQEYDENTYTGAILPAPEGYVLSACFRAESELQDPHKRDTIFMCLK
ncbi:MAG: 4'-phosphopantetheinyl transferase superfamily protein [Lachnospiraceae bacterium]|nr:4'-phosphopantetheinyl transferase superfamily protein [Lachnospiraceae bacterium]